MSTDDHMDVVDQMSRWRRRGVETVHIYASVDVQNAAVVARYLFHVGHYAVAVFHGSPHERIVLVSIEPGHIQTVAQAAYDYLAAGADTVRLERGWTG